MPWIVPNRKKNPTSFYVKDKSSEINPKTGSHRNVHVGTFDCLHDAQTRVAELKAFKANTPDGYDFKKGKAPLRTYFEDYRDQFAIHKRGYLQSDRYVIAALLSDASSAKSLMDKPIMSVTPQDIKDWINTRTKEGIAKSTIRRQLSYFEAVFKVCREEWNFHWLNDPTKQVKKPVDDSVRERRLKPKEQKRLLDVAAKSNYPYLARVIEFALETAMRQGEIGSAKVEDYDAEYKTLHIPGSRTKNGEGRTIPLTERAVQLVEEALKAGKNDEDLIFDATGNAIKIAWQRAIAKHFTDLHFHDLRHEATSRLFELGILNTEQIKSITGHKTYTCLTRYTHLNARHTGRVLRGEMVMMESKALAQAA